MLRLAADENFNNDIVKTGVAHYVKKQIGGQ